ncbi:PAS domain-containing protein [Haloplanus rallus]|uniref:PAS domain-containing protein n=2 Tax=Haloferacaceae TaxID=1644056 RepID=A0A6B9F5R4_9EURY|nr:PAS domain-containing protein [Haloplanus rallus]
MVLSMFGTLQGLYVVVFSLAGLVCLGALLGVRTLSHADIRRGLAGLFLLNGVWALLMAIRLLLPTLSSKRVVYLFGLIAGIGTVFAWLYFASAYSGRQYHRSRSLRLVAVAVFSSIVLIKVTNPIHGAYMQMRIVTEPFHHARVTHFAPHWLVTGFSYTVSGLGFWFLFDSFADADTRPTALYLLVSVTALPLVPYIAAYYHEGPVLLLNYEPIGIAIFALGVFWYARGEFTRLSNPDQSSIAESISEGVLILDDQGTVVNYNDSAASVLENGPVQGQSLDDVDAELASLDSGETTILSRSVSDQSAKFECHREDIEAETASEAITLTDVSQIVHLEDVARLFRELNKVLIQNGDPDEFTTLVPEKLSTIDAYRMVWLCAPTDDETGYVAGQPDGYVHRQRSDIDSPDPVGRAADTGDIHVADVDPNSDEGWEAAAADRGITACLAVPLHFPTGREYVLGVYTTALDGVSEAEIELFRDISEAVPNTVAAITAHQEAKEYQKAVEHAGYAIFITDIDGVIRHVNPAFEEITGYTADEAIGKTPRILKSGEMDEEYYERLWETVLGGEVFSDEIINKTKSGDRYLAHQTAAPVTDETGEPIAFVAIQVELTEDIVRKQRLSVLNRLLRHNLRNKLNVISLQMARLEDLYKSSSDASERDTQARQVVQEVQRVTEEIMTRSEKAHEIEQIFDRLDATGECMPLASATKSVRRTLSDTEATTTLDVAENLDCYEITPEILTIVDELITNAVKHNTSSDPTVHVAVTLSDDSEVRFSVSDNGPGLSAQEQHILTEGEETQLNHSSGLGLWMVTWIVTYCGGMVAAEVDEEGTTIDVLLPVWPTEGGRERSRVGSPTDGGRE